MDQVAQDHWKNYTKLWKHIKPPLKPCSQDIALIERALRKRYGQKPLKAVLLGVTEELSRRNWDCPISITAIDNEMATISRVWPKEAEEKQVVCGDWFSMPFSNDSFDVCIGDGSLNAIGSVVDYKKAAKEVSRVLKKNGLFVVRVYIRPSEPETGEQIFADISNIENFHILKWRMAMAIQERNPNVGVRLHDIWAEISQRIESNRNLAMSTGWPLEEISTIDAYKNKDVKYTFPTITEIAEALVGSLSLVDIHFAKYQLAKNCPTFTFRKR